MANKKKPDQPTKRLAKKTQKAKGKTKQPEKPARIIPPPPRPNHDQLPKPLQEPPVIPPDDQPGAKPPPESGPGSRSAQQFVPITEDEILLQQLLKKYNIDKRQLVGMIATGKINMKVPKGRPGAIDAFKASNMLALALVGLRPQTVAKVLGVDVRTLQNYLKKNPDFKEMFKNNRMSRFQHLMSKAWQQVNNGYWPAIEFMLKNFFGDFMKAQLEGIKPGDDDTFDPSDEGGAIESEIKVTVTQYTRQIDQKILEAIEDESGDEEAVKVDRVTPAELGEAIDAEYTVFEDDNGKNQSKGRGKAQGKGPSEKQGQSQDKTKKGTEAKEPENPDYY